MARSPRLWRLGLTTHDLSLVPCGLVNLTTMNNESRCDDHQRQSDDDARNNNTDAAAGLRLMIMLKITSKVKVVDVKQIYINS